MDWTGLVKHGLDWTRLVKHGLDPISKTWTGLKSLRLVKHGLDSKALISKTWTQLLQLLFSQLLFLFVQLILSEPFLSILSIIIYEYNCPLRPFTFKHDIT